MPTGFLLSGQMRPIQAWLCYLVLVFFGGALVAPWLYWAVKLIGGHFPSLQYLSANPFHRFVDRSILLCAMAMLWPFLRRIGVQSWDDVGLTRPSGQWKNVVVGFAWGFISMAVVAMITFSWGARAWNSNLAPGKFVEIFSSAVISAVVVAVLEELLFRGALLGSLQRSRSWPFALVVSSGFYALVHFFQRPEEPAQISWSSGFVALGRMLGGFVDSRLLIPGFLTLLVAGSILALAFLRTKNIYQSIGLHAGWIFWLKVYGRVSTETPLAREHVSFWGTGKLFDGWLSFIILLPVFLIFWRNYFRCDENSLNTGTEKLA